MRYSLRAFRTFALTAGTATGLLLTGGGVALADPAGTQADANAMSFGILGPVGLAAVALGIVGMALGVLRQRRKSRAEAAASSAPAGEQAGSVAALAEAVLADAERPTRPYLTPHPRA